MRFEAQLLSDGFSAIRMTCSSIGQFLVRLQYDVHELTMILDSGASSSVVDIKKANRLDVDLEHLGVKAAGVGTSAAQVFRLPERKIRIGDLELAQTRLLAMDLSHVNQALDERNVAAVDGVLGTDILISHKAIVACSEATLFLKTPASETLPS
ncbi:MAG: hypothetical protein Aurels2KO_02650 [Aureliella sp.]